MLNNNTADVSNKQRHINLLKFNKQIKYNVSMYTLLSFANAGGQFLVRSRAGFSILFTTIQNVILLLGFLEQ